MNFPKKIKKVIAVVDATTSLEESDQHHAGRTTIKRKAMAQLETQKEREAYAVERSERRDAKKLKKYGVSELGDLSQLEMGSLRDEINEMTKGKMTKQQRRQLEKDRLTKIGAVVHEHKHSRKSIQRQRSNDLQRDIDYYKSQDEIGMAVGLANPLQAHRKKMEEKYDGKKVQNIKLHAVGKMGKDGTLTIGKKAIARTDNKLREERSGGISTGRMFKRMKK